MSCRRFVSWLTSLVADDREPMHFVVKSGGVFYIVLLHSALVRGISLCQCSNAIHAVELERREWLVDNKPNGKRSQY